MNIQEYFDEKERKENERVGKQDTGINNPTGSTEHKTDSTVIPIVQEQARIDKKEIETAKVKVQKKVVEVEKNIDIPLLQEGYAVERVPINQYVEAYPQIREEGDKIIIPVVREVLVTEKRLELVEEVHVIKQSNTVHHTESFTLRKEEVNVVRTPTGNNNL